MSAYYNEFDPFAAAWLRELIKAGHIAPGEVDERSIKEVQPDELRNFKQVHFFAGIGGWSYALRLARWADDAPVWTGSCPCQPFSAAGKRRAEADERHLWPEMLRLVAACRPSVVFGEQVGGPLGYEWLARVYADLEAEGYRVPRDERGNYEAYDLPAASVEAPHIRQRIYWLADVASGLACNGDSQRSREHGLQPASGKFAVGVADAEHAERRPEHEADREASRGHRLGGGGAACGPGWRDFELVECADGKTRRIKSGLEPLVNGLPGRLGRLRGYGNAIVPELAAQIVEAYREARGMT